MRSNIDDIIRDPTTPNSSLSTSKFQQPFPSARLCVPISIMRLKKAYLTSIGLQATNDFMNMRVASLAFVSCLQAQVTYLQLYHLNSSSCTQQLYQNIRDCQEVRPCLLTIETSIKYNHNMAMEPNVATSIPRSLNHISYTPSKEMIAATVKESSVDIRETEHVYHSSFS